MTILFKSPPLALVMGLILTLTVSAVSAPAASGTDGNAVSGERRSPKASVTFSSDSLFLGNPFTMSILIDGSDIVERPDTSKIKDFSVRFLDETSLKLRGKTGFAIRYKLVPLKRGAANIPPLTIHVDGDKTISTPAAKLAIGLPEKDPGIRLDMKISKHHCYVGEPLILNVSWDSTHTFNEYRAVEFELPVLGSKNFEIREERGDPTKRPGAISLPVSNTRIVAMASKAVIDGTHYNVITFRKILVPKKSGETAVPAATLLCARMIPKEGVRRRRGPQYPAFFNNDFFRQPQRGKYKLQFAESRPETLKVEPLPEKNRPPNFLGVVGEFAVSATTDRTEVDVGDPITVSLATRPANPLFVDNAIPPPLDAIPAIANNFIISEPWFASDASTKDKTVFTATIIPKSTRITAIPSFEMPCFAPDTGKYIVAKTAPIEITVHPAKAVTALDAELSGGNNLKNLIVKNQHGISGNEYSTSALERHRAVPAICILATFLLPPLAFLAFLAATAETRLSRRDPAAARSKYALRHFHAFLASTRSDGALESLEKASRRYFADKFDTLPYAHTKADVATELGKHPEIDEKALQAVLALYAALDAERFAGQSPAVDSAGLKRSIPKAIASIDRALGWKKTLRKNISALSAAIAIPLALLFSAVSAPPLNAADGSLAAKTDAEIFNAANATFENANETALTRPDEARSLYAQAALEYRFLTNQREIETSTLYKNLGNAYLMSGDVGRAILSYERARLLDPSDNETDGNLRYARSLAMDDTGRTIAARLASAIFFWHSWPCDVRTALFAVFWLATWTLAAVLLFKKTRVFKWTFSATTVAALLLAASIAVSELRLSDRYDAVVVAEKVVARKGDSNIYAEAFTSPLHSGTECKILEQRKNWLKVELPAGEQCWIPTDALEKIRK